MKQGILIIIAALALSPAAVHGQGPGYGLRWSYTADGWVTGAAVSADGRYVAAGSEDQMVYLLNSTGGLIWRRKIHGAVTDLSIDGSGSYIAAGSTDTNIYVMDRNGSMVLLEDLGSDEVSEVSISKDGRYVAAAAKDRVYLLSMDRVLLWSQRLDGDVRGLSISENGSYIAAGSEAGSIYLFDRDGRIIWTYGSGLGLSGVSIAGDGSYVAAASRLNDLYMVNDRGVLVWSRKIGWSPLDVAVLDHGLTVAALTEEGGLYLYSREGNLTGTFALNGPVHGFSISKDGSYIAASYDRPSRELRFFAEALPEQTAAKESPVEVILLANSVDLDGALDLLLFLKSSGARVIHVSASDFMDRYRQSGSVVILGGPDAYEQVGGVVREILSEDEQRAIREPGSREMYVKSGVWASGQRIIVIAGSDRAGTMEAHRFYRARLASELGL